MKDLQDIEQMKNEYDLEDIDGVIRYIVVNDFTEYMHKCNETWDIRVIAVLKGERNIRTLADVISVCRRGQEIEIESIINAFSNALEFMETINLALEKGVVIKTMDGNFTTEDVEDVPAMAYVFKSITSLLNVDKFRASIYPKGFLKVICRYMNKNITESEACRMLGIQRAQFYRLLKKAGARRRNYYNE
jgi:DNA-binding NtrC family response regulator